ncbi:ABC transporter substrate-binding protein [Shimia sediminis]|uniref:ABC transporter substrate-binding protein n=1 Tax=Shimia sediminis TaxID=2497945 RepID=UPI001981849D|nr:ABC transporter substrate-binding protein [Shimia sediminis]
MGIATAVVASTSAIAADLTVGVNVGNVPWEFQQNDGQIVGFEVDLINEIANRLGKSVELQNTAWEGIFTAVRSGRVDVAIASITITDERLESIGFAQPYYDSDQSLVVMADSGISTLEDMRGKVVAVDAGATGHIWADENQAEVGFAEVRTYPNINSSILDLSAGRVDAYISDIPAMQYYVRDKPQFSVAERIPTGERYSMIFAKGSPLIADADAVISELKAEGFLDSLHEKWFGVPADETSSTVQVREIP